MTQRPLTLRTAFEALRAGVPNRAAVLLLGSVEDAIEDQFETSLTRSWGGALMSPKTATVTVSCSIGGAAG